MDRTPTTIGVRCVTHCALLCSRPSRPSPKMTLRKRGKGHDKHRQKGYFVNHHAQELSELGNSTNLQLPVLKIWEKQLVLCHGDGCTQQNREPANACVCLYGVASALCGRESADRPVKGSGK